MEEDKSTQSEAAKDSTKVPEDSVFYDKLVPILLISLGVIMLLLILIAGGVLLGLL